MRAKWPFCVSPTADLELTDAPLTNYPSLGELVKKVILTLYQLVIPRCSLYL